jgi:hypothetical protein
MNTLKTQMNGMQTRRCLWGTAERLRTNPAAANEDVLIWCLKLPKIFSYLIFYLILHLKKSQ